MEFNSKQISIIQAYLKALRSKKDYPTVADLTDKGIGKGLIDYNFHSLENLKEAAQRYSPKTFKECIKEKKGDELSETQVEIVKSYLKLIRAKVKYPSIADLEKEAVTVGKLNYNFGSLESLRKAAKKHSPDTFKDIIDEEIYSPEKFAKIKSTAEGYSKFIITTAVTGCPVHKGFYKALKQYCKTNKAMLLILPATDPASSAGWNLDPALANEHIVMSDLALNENIWISTIKLSAKQIDPITGLARIGHRNGSFIYASPKQRLRMVATSNIEMPRALMTTGAITKANYGTDRYMSERTAYISTIDHVLGAVIVELDGDKFYHFRQIQAEKSGNFVDLGRYYQPETVGQLRPEAIILGDYHAGQTDPVAEKAFQDLVKEVKPKRAIFHDLFNGLSINHHEKNQHILKAVRALNNELDLEKEIIAASEVLSDYLELVDECVVVKSNHDEFLERYLDEGMYIKDPQNKKIALELALAMLNGLDPLRIGVEKFLGVDKAVRWLKRDEDYKIARIELGAHGDLGANGGSPSMLSLEYAYGNSVSGHAHTPEILRGAWRVGTCSYLKLEYNTGPSSWLHSSCLIYSNGSRQLINVINGKCKG